MPPAWIRATPCGVTVFDDDAFMRPVLIVVGGLPATGKSTFAARIAEAERAPYLRVDRIEHAIVGSSQLRHPVGVVGYAVAYALAEEQLLLGLDVVVECVNPIAVTRDAWRSTADRASASIVEVELICSDKVEHQRRVETRTSDVDGLIKPTWEQVAGRVYESWERPHLVIDTAGTTTGEAVGRILMAIATAREGAMD